MLSKRSEIQILEDLRKYLNESIGVVVGAHETPNSAGFPQFIRQEYAFASATLLDKEFLLLFAREPRRQTPASIRKHAEWIKRNTGRAVIYICESMASYNRRRLIEHKVPFIVPGNQLYLPDLGLDLREHLRQARAEKKLLSPATQLVLLHFLVRDPGDSGDLTPTSLAEELEYTSMTMTRAINELEYLKLIDVRRLKRERLFLFRYQGRELWDNAQAALRSPVRKRTFAEIRGPAPIGIEAGLTALSRRTMLAAPSPPTYAFSAREWKRIKASERLIEIPDHDHRPDCCEIELWSYSPEKLAKDGMADPFSLYLNLRETTDERVESALAEMMGKVPW